MKSATVLRAARLIQAGEVFELGRVLTETMPLPAGRRFEVLTKRTRNDPGRNRRGSNEELVVSEIAQVGTQFDTFSHQMIGSSMYNCVTLDQKDNARHQCASPGLGTAAAEWLATQDPMLVGADNTAVEISPNPDKDLAGPVHQIMLVENGIHLLENLRLDELAARRAYEFALIVEPLKIQGGTGSTVAPIAVR
jgi:hypothetical protein